MDSLQVGLPYMESTFSCVSIFHSYTCEVCPYMMDVPFIDRREKYINRDCTCILPWAAAALQHKMWLVYV